MLCLKRITRLWLEASNALKKVSNALSTTPLRSPCLSAICLLWVVAIAAESAEPAILGRGVSEGMHYRIERVAEGFGVPWGMAFVDDTSMVVTGRTGKAWLLDTEHASVMPLEGIPEVWAEGQGGLLDVQVQRDAGKTSWLYFTYAAGRGGQGVTVLARAVLNGALLTHWQTLLVTDSATDTGRHFGSRIAFDNEGHVFFTVGDRGHRPSGQDLMTHAGKVLRLNLDGSVPQDNPFVGRVGALDEIWSYGHRNPQGIVFDLQGEKLWLSEHGPRGGDEINLVAKGKNYGWPRVSRGREYLAPFAVGEATSLPGMEDPKLVYVPSIAPGSLMLYRGAAFPRWQGDFFLGALKLTHLNRVRQSVDGELREVERLLGSLNERIRQVIEDRHGWIYISTDSGQILRLVPDVESDQSSG